MFTSSAPDGSYLAHMHGTQSVIAHRDRNSLRDGNNHLALLCTHMVSSANRPTQYESSTSVACGLPILGGLVLNRP